MSISKSNLELHLNSGQNTRGHKKDETFVVSTQYSIFKSSLVLILHLYISYKRWLKISCCFCCVWKLIVGVCAHHVSEANMQGDELAEVSSWGLRYSFFAVLQPVECLFFISKKSSFNQYYDKKSHIWGIYRQVINKSSLHAPPP